jgi:hypothetical protein
MMCARMMRVRAARGAFILTGRVWARACGRVRVHSDMTMHFLRTWMQYCVEFISACSPCGSGANHAFSGTLMTSQGHVC